MTLALSSGEWSAELRPEIGGALSSLRLRDVEVLRTMAPDAVNPLEAACFPLAPYCNRIAEARFPWAGKEVQLPHNFPPETSSLHGNAWQQPWQVTSVAGFKASLEFAHEGADCWPWPYHVQQRVRLGAKGLAISLDLTNRGDSAMPCGLGLHPYVRRRPETRVRFASQGMLAVDERLIPTGRILPPQEFGDWTGGSMLPDQLIDHCFTGWDGTVEIADDLGTITLTARGAPFLHVYSPSDGSTLCFEPVSNPPDAVNRWPEAMTRLPSGCSATLTMWITAS